MMFDIDDNNINFGSFLNFDSIANIIRITWVLNKTTITNNYRKPLESRTFQLFIQPCTLIRGLLWHVGHPNSENTNTPLLTTRHSSRKKKKSDNRNHKIPTQPCMISRSQ